MQCKTCNGTGIFRPAVGVAGTCDKCGGTGGVAGPHETSAAGVIGAPTEFSEEQVGIDPILRYFHYAHLPPKLQTVSKQFFETAQFIVTNCNRTPERTVALRKLLEAKDAAVRSNV